MDQIDKIILSTLQENGRTPFTQIAKEAGVSETTIRSRYRSLVEQGVVRTVGIVDPYALDLQAPAIIGVSVEPGTTEQVAKRLMEIPEISYLVTTLGSYDLIVEVFCRDLPHLFHLLTQQMHSIPGIRSTETLMITRTYKLSRFWPSLLELEAEETTD
jgi:Lrp/AsnC family transcriptional regulator for asnA, asnC and gidA